MKGYARILFPGQYLQGAGIIARLPGLIEAYGGCAYSIISPPVFAAFEAVIKTPSLCERSGDLCSLPEIDCIAEKAAELKCTIIIGAGGGNTLDLAKAVADRLNLPVIICPTTAASDAPCTCTCMVNNEQGKVVKVIRAKQNPNVVLVDTDIILTAPLRHLSAGMADCLSTWYETYTCEKTDKPSVCGADRSLTAMALARLSYDTVYTYGPQAYADAKAGVNSAAFDKIVEANILCSGVGGESGGISAPHALGNTASVLERAHGALHGEKVSFGILCTLFLNHAPESEISETYAFFESLGMPTRLTQLGLDNITDEELDKWVAAACSRHEFIRNEACEISEEIVRDAILKADAYGRNL